MALIDDGFKKDVSKKIEGLNAGVDNRFYMGNDFDLISDNDCVKSIQFSENLIYEY